MVTSCPHRDLITVKLNVNVSEQLFEIESSDGSDYFWRRFESRYSQMLKRFKCICNPSSVSSLWKYPLTVWCSYYVHYLCQKFPLVINLLADKASISQLIVAESFFFHSMKQQAPIFHRIWQPGSAHFDLAWQGFAFPSQPGCLLEVSWITAKKMSPLIQLLTLFISYNFFKISTNVSVRNVIIIFEGSLRLKLLIDIRSFDSLIASKTVKHVPVFTDQTISHLIEVAVR